MYLEHFGLRRHPFRMTPEDDFVYMSQQHSRAFVYMNSAIWSAEGFVVISGEIGSGKTTLLKKTIRSLEGNLKLLHVSYTNLKSDDFFRLLIHQAGIKTEMNSKVTMLFAIMDYLQMMADRGTPVVLAVDEAQNLTKENLEDIRKIFTLVKVNGSLSDPTSLTLRMSDGSDDITVVKGEIFSRVDGYTADITYPPNNKQFRNRRSGEKLFFAEDMHNIVAISESEVVLSTASTSKRTTIRLQ